jgi:antitoxin Phd
MAVRKMPDWQLQEAKNRFSELFDEARERGPQRVTRHGKKAVIVVSEEEWRRVTKKIPSLATLLAECPLEEGDLIGRRPARVFKD